MTKMAGSRSSLVLAFLLLTQFMVIWAQTGPAFCTYSGDVYTCDYASMSSGNRPIDFTGFSQQPQLLTVTVNGYFPYSGDTQTFSSTFNNMNPSTFDSNFPAQLTIDCGRGGSVFVGSGAFFNMSYVQHLKIKNCITYNVPAYGFADLQSLDYFGFEGGSIDSIDPNAMAGVDVQKLIYDVNQIPRFRGHFEVVNCQLPSNTVPPGLLYSWKNLTSVTLKATGITSISSDVFRYNTNLRYTDLSDNGFTSIPSGLFSGIDKLSDVTMYNIDWSCSCANLWFVPYAVTNNITLFGDFMCSNAQGQTAFNYYYSQCEAAESCSGMAMGDKCIPVLGVMAIFMAFIAIVVIIAATVLACMNKKDLEASKPEGEVNNNGEDSDIRQMSGRKRSSVGTMAQAGQPKGQSNGPLKTKFVNKFPKNDSIV